MAFTLIICIAALLLDRLLGEPRRWHPLVGLGHVITQLERHFNGAGKGRVRDGGLAVVLLVLPFVVLGAVVSFLPVVFSAPLAAIMLWLCIGWRSLTEHGMAVYRPLVEGNLTEARTRVGMMVSRDTRELDATDVATATSESLLENGADAIFASLFWFIVAGLPGLLLHRVVNTLDAMWGYRTARFNRLGRVAAVLDDVLNWIPARLVALGYALTGHTGLALRCWRTQAPAWDSPNAGPVMAAGAGALALQLGGGAPYHDGWRERPVLGTGAPASAEAIPEVLKLIGRNLVLWMAVLAVLAMLVESTPAGIF